jgi:ribosomal protein S18 acetylase RimI-like enzyme
VKRAALTVRSATPDDAPALARIISQAFEVERFFKVGDRTNPEEVASLLRDGEFLVLEDPPGTVAGCVYVKRNGDRSYFGMLSIDPSLQGRGLGRALVDEVESRARAAGCRYMDIQVVNLREELPPFYRRLGYVETGTAPFPEDERTTKPCHFILMSKTL